MNMTEQDRLLLAFPSQCYIIHYYFIYIYIIHNIMKSLVCVITTKRLSCVSPTCVITNSSHFVEIILNCKVGYDLVLRSQNNPTLSMPISNLKNKL